VYAVNKISSYSAVDYAAEELRKYLRMMMPECGNIEINYDPNAKDGFRLGLMQDFGLDVSDAEDTVLDDILYIDTDSKGGIIAGDNPRSVLLAVYEYLRQNGCRWLMPGVDGEFIPMQNIVPVKYRFKPTSRYRGMCNEGSEFQSDMVDFIEFLPKVGMNVFMMEFFIPTSYYRRYYNHEHNQANRPPEPVTPATILQWKCACEAELSMRGLQFHDIGHGWGTQAFGIDSSVRASDGDNDSKLTPEQRSVLAVVNGEQKLWGQTPNFTQFCMSSADNRRTVVNFVADYAGKHTNVDYLHVWLGDGFNNHCECENCVKKTPSDWYVVMINELDRELSARKLDTRIVFIIYGDSLWAPEKEEILNQERFTLLFAPIARSYTDNLDGAVKEDTPAFALNKNGHPDSVGQILCHLDNWRKTWRGSSISYEYHFWRHQYYEPCGIRHSEMINSDIKHYGEIDISGVIQDGSQRSFFPTGLAFYTYARTLYDSSLNMDEIAEEYFSSAFGEDWKLFYNYLRKLGDALDTRFIAGKNSADKRRSLYYLPEYAEKLPLIKEILTEGRELIASHYNSDFRVRTVSVRLLEFHARYIELLAEALAEKAKGNDEAADELYVKFRDEVGKYELQFERWYDQGLIFYALDRIFKTRTNVLDDVMY